jgi:hypothetical protein
MTVTSGDILTVQTDVSAEEEAAATAAAAEAAAETARLVDAAVAASLAIGATPIHRFGEAAAAFPPTDGGVAYRTACVLTGMAVAAYVPSVSKKPGPVVDARGALSPRTEAFLARKPVVLSIF